MARMLIMDKNKMKKLIKVSLLKTLPVMAGYMVLGIGFGIISSKNGLGIVLPVLMSLFIYAGSMQYVAVSLIVSGASFVVTALTTLMVNARHLFYGITMVDKYKNTGKKKPYLIFDLTDETYSLVCTEQILKDDEFKKYAFLVSLFNHFYWVFGTLTGSILGTVIPFNSKGIEFAMTALFIAVFVEQWKGVDNHIPAITGVLVSVFSLIFFGAEKFLIPAMIIITLILIMKKPNKPGGGIE